MENKKKYIAPQMEIVVFACADGMAEDLTRPSGFHDALGN